MMNISYKISAIVLILSGFYFSSQAQPNKTCDLQLSQIKYENDEEIPLGDTVFGIINVKNLGPDTLVVDEPIFVGKSTFYLRPATC